MNDRPQDLKRAAAGGVFWTASSQALRQALQLGVTVVLARALRPEDFGLIGMAAVTLAFITPLNEMGMGAALVQKKDMRPGHATSVFWSQVVLASAAGLVLALAAPVVAGFFLRDDLVPLLRIMCLNLPLGAAASAPQALLLRRLRFGSVAAVETVAIGGAGALAAFMALTGWGIYSLVAQSLCGAALTAGLMIAMARFNPLAPSARPRLVYLRELARFSGPLTAYQMLNFASRNVDDVLIGRFLGAGALGYYSMAYRVMMYPLQKVSGIVGRVSFPTFASMQDDLPRIRRGYLKAVQYIALITFPMMATVMVAAPELTRVVFGPNWAPVAPLIIILSLAGMAGSVGTTVGSIFLARGRSDLMLRWEMAASTCFVAAIATGLYWGLTGVAIAYTTMALILWPISHLLANRLIELRMRDLAGALAPPASLAAALSLALVGLRLVWHPAEPAAQVGFLCACGGLAALAYGVAALSGWPAAVGEAMSLARETFAGLRAPREGEAQRG